MGGGMVNASTFHGEALILLDTPHRLQLQPPKGQPGSVVFPNDEHVMNRRAVLMVLSLLILLRNSIPMGVVYFRRNVDVLVAAVVVVAV